MWKGLLFLAALLAVHQTEGQGICRVPLDIVFVLDSSGSIRDLNVPGQKDNYDFMKDFIVNIVNGLDPDSRFGLVYFSDVGATSFYLNDHSNRGQIINAIRQVPYVGANTNTASGLREALTHFTPENGDRAGVDNVVIVITDGASTFERERTIPSAEALHKENIITYAIGVTNNVNETELRYISSPPRQLNSQYFLSADFNLVDEILDTLVEQICITPSPPPSACTADIDIGFIIDGSGSIRDANPTDGSYDNWNLLLQFVANIIQRLPVGPQVRVGAVLFSDRGQLLFRLDEFTNSGDASNAILRTTYPGANTNTSGGIYVARSQLFNPANGDRPGVRNVAIVITDGKSTFDNDKTIPYAEDLRRDGVNVIVLGITSSVDEVELKAMSSEPQVLNQNYFTSANFNTLQPIINGLVQQACETTSVPPPTCAADLDIVFIIDGSGSIRDANPTDNSYDNWNLLLQFVAGIIDFLPVGQSATRVAAVLFSDRGQLLFPLNRFDDKEAAKAEVLRTVYPAANTNTSGGLYVARTEAFLPRNGDRPNVQNVAIVITDGKSTFDSALTVPYAVELQNAGVNVFSIGITNSVDEEELKAISSPPQLENFNYFTSPSFRELQGIIFSLVAQACATTTAPPLRCSSDADIGFIIDGSGSIRDANPDDQSYDNWNLVLQFVSNLINRLPSSGTRVGAVLFSDQGRLLFTLDEYDLPTASQVILQTPYPSANTNTSGGLWIARSQLFNVNNGDRPNVPNLAIVITDGKSTFDNQLTIPTAKDLRDDGVEVISVGITDSIDEAELKGISSEPQLQNQNYFTSPDFTQLQNIFEELLSRACFTTTTPQPSCEADLDVVFIIDGSGSIRDANPPDNAYDNWNLLLGFVSGIVQGLPFENGKIRFGLVLFSDRGSVEFTLDEYVYQGSQTESNLIAAISNLAYPGANTNTSGGLLVARDQLFSGSGGDRPNAQNVAIVITDGKSTYDNAKTLDSARMLRERNTNVIVVGITDSVDEDELRGISSLPQIMNRNYFTSPDFQQLGTILNGLLSQACVTTAAPSPDCPGRADVVLIVDSSGSIQEDRFTTLKMWLSSMVQNLDLETGQIRLGLLQFSDSQNLIFHLNKYRSRQDVQNEIENLRYIRGTTKTAEALRYARENMFTSLNGDRPDTPNIALVLTDGGSDDKDRTVMEAVLLKTSGTHIISMGIGSWTDEQELISIASYPYAKNYVKVSSFDVLNQFTQRLTDVICNRVNECRSRPCRNGECVDSFDSYICNCPPGFGGLNCEKSCNNPSDVIFALDSSGSIDRENFQRMVDFTTNAILDLPIGAGARVGLLTFSTEARVYVNLRDQATKTALLNSLSIPYFTGGTTNTAAAIRTMWQNMFTSQEGDRPNNPNVGIVITDGKSNEPVATWNEAMQARDRGIEMIAVGVGDSVRTSELEAIASYPTANNVFVVERFQNLRDEANNLYDSICNTNNECGSNPCQNNGRCVDLMNGYRCECIRGYTGTFCERRCDGSADVAFLLDRSGSIRNERWHTVLNFVNTIVDNLEIGPNRVQVAAATYSDDAALEFRLNQYKTKQDVMEAVYRIKYSGGRTNTAGGLEVIRQQIFRQDQGDRQNVPNYLIIVSDGNSNIRAEETLPQAIAARIEGIHVVTVAIGQLLNMMELRGLASDPVEQNVLSVDSFSVIDTLKNPLIMSMCDDLNECNSNPCQNGGTCINGLKKYICVCPREQTGENCERTCRRQYDIIFLLDFSGSVEESYNITIAFTRRVIFGLEFRFDRVRVGMATFANNTDMRFNLNTYQDKQDVLNALSFPRTGGMTNTQDALRMANDRMLTRNAGERNGVEDVVIILTDGGSNVNAANTIPAARALKSRGVRIYAASVGRMADLNEVQQIATTPSAPHVLRIDSQAQVDQAASSLLDDLCQ